MFTTKMSAATDSSDGVGERKRKGDVTNEDPERKKQREESLHSAVASALRSLQRSIGYSMCALKIRQCNGCTGYGATFTSADCVTEIIQTPCYPIGAIFNKGIAVLDNFMRGCIPKEDEIKTTLCNRLLNFLADEDLQLHMRNLKRISPRLNETELSIALAEHLFSVLALKKSYRLDKTSKRADCNNCKLCGCDHDDKFGDTSIGKENVWHGHPDIIIGIDEEASEEVPVVIPRTQETSPGGKTPEEVKLNELKELLDKKLENQMIAQTIVFSFLQKKRHPSAEHFLIPCIGINHRQVIFFFYDSELDVLLQTVEMSLFLGDVIFYPTVVAIWLVVNYKYLGSGLTGSLRNISKSNFFNLAGDMIDVYKDELREGNVLYSTRPKILHHAMLNASDFLYPEDVDKHEILIE